MSSERLLETFLELVRIDSPSGKEAEVAAYCAERLSRLGFDVRFDATQSVTGSNTGNLIASHSGTGRGSKLVLSAHMDCVQPCIGVEPVVLDGIISSAGETILGGDDKAGIAVILEGLERLVESSETFGPIDVVFTVSEETGLTGAKALAVGDVEGDLCLVFDAAGEPGGIVVAAPTHYTFTARFLGQAAHAGVEPEQGSSAIVMASRAICVMPHGRLDEATTANIGTIEGGVATNVVAAEALLSGECRSLERSRVDQVRDGMDAVMHDAAREGGGSVEVAWTIEYEGFRFSEDDPILTLLEDAMLDIDLTPFRFETGGGSDGSILYAAGVPTLVLSSGLRNVHSTDESVSVEDLESLTKLVCAVAARLVE